MLETERLLLRQWQDDDRAPFAELNADPEVMRYFPNTLTREQSDAGIDRVSAHIDEHGWGFFAVERKDTAEFIGFVGITHITPDLPVAPGVEIGWRLAQQHWHQGFASEAARHCLTYAFTQLHLDRVVAFTSLNNHPSRAVMRTIGMQDTGTRFEHPAVPVHSPLRTHCLYASVPSR